MWTFRKVGSIPDECRKVTNFSAWFKFLVRIVHQKASLSPCVSASEYLRQPSLSSTSFDREELEERKQKR